MVTGACWGLRAGDNRVLSVEYVAREADGRNNEADRGGGGYGGSDRGGRTRSRSPYRCCRPVALHMIQYLGSWLLCLFECVV
jgi:hypothetical protein